MALKYIAQKRHRALDWDGILLGKDAEAYRSGRIHEEYQISFNDLLLKLEINASPEDVKIFVKWNEASISDLETRYICALILGMKAEKIFEIGTYLGDTTVNLAYNADDNAKVYTLNLSQEKSNFIVGKSITEHQEAAHKIIQLLGDSKEFDFSPFYNQIDLMFIDGNHNYDYVLNDGKNAVRCVKNGGFIVWQNYSRYDGTDF